MPGTAAGYKKFKENKIKQYGSEEAWKNAEVRVFGKRGGEASRSGGFASDKVGKDGLTGRERAKLMGKTQGRGQSESKQTKSV